MKRIWITITILLLCNLSSAQNITMANGNTSPTIPITMFVKATGLPVTGLDVTTLRVCYAEYRTAAVGVITPSSLANLGSAYGGATGVVKMFEAGGGGYRLDLPPEAVDGGIHTFVMVWCWDATTYAAATNVGYAIVQLTPASDAVLTGGTTPPTWNLPSANPGTAGGLFIAGTNAETTITSGTAGQAALTLTGNTTGAGFKATGGIGGPGMELIGGLDSAGLIAYGDGIDSGIRAVGGETGDGMSLYGGNTSGDDLYLEKSKAPTLAEAIASDSTFLSILARYILQYSF
jgi:hypothetical protein